MSEQEHGAEELFIARVEALKRRPFLSKQDLCYFLDLNYQRAGTPTSDVVEVDKIVSAGYMKNWGNVPNGVKYLQELVAAIQTGTLDLTQAPVNLIEYGGAYMIGSDGRHRVIAAKLLGLKTIPASVRRYIVSHAYARTIADFGILMNRKARREWQSGAMETSLGMNGGEMEFTASIEVQSYKGVWVFAKDMNIARAAYEAAGADGRVVEK